MFPDASTQYMGAIYGGFTAFTNVFRTFGFGPAKNTQMNQVSSVCNRLGS